MAVAHDPLAALAGLERRFNGPIPEPLLAAARVGSAALAELLLAEGQAAFFKAMALGQVSIIRRRRREGSFYAALMEDLVLYRERWRFWRRRARSLRASIEPPARACAQAIAAE